jgi:hypothetical protein
MSKKKQLITFLNLIIIMTLLLPSIGTVYANTSTGAETEPEVSVDQTTYSYVNCDTMSKVFAFDVAKGQNPNDFDVFFGEVSKMGHTVAVWNTTEDGAPPSCVEKLMIASASSMNCLNDNPYTVSEAAVIESWVSEGGRLLLMEEHYTCSSVHNVTEALGIMPQPDPNSVHDTDEEYEPGNPSEIVFDEGNFRVHPLFGEWEEDCYILEVVLFTTGWWNDDSTWVIRSDMDGSATPPGAVVASAFNYGSGKVFLVGDYDMLIDLFDYVFEADNLQFGINVVRWLNDEPICPEEPVGGELIPYNSNRMTGIILLTVLASFLTLGTIHRKDILKP